MARRRRSRAGPRSAPWPTSRSTSTRTSSRSRSGSTTSPRTSSAPPRTSGTSGRRRRGRSSRRRPRSASTRWSSGPTRSPTPPGLTWPIVSEEMCWGDAGIALAIFGSTLAVSGIIANGTPEQIGEWVPQCFGTPEKIQLGAFCVSEPDAGSDVSSLRTRAVYDEAKDEWVLNGTKTWITNGGIADVHVVVASVDPELEGARSGQLRGAARHARSAHGPEVQEARHPRQPHRRGRARRRARPRELPARRQGEARRAARTRARGSQQHAARPR